MARQEIVLGTPPQGLGGDTPRVASMKINAMTQELYDSLPTNAAPLAVNRGGTGGKTASEARLSLGLVPAASNVDITAGCLLVPGSGGVLGPPVAITNANGVTFLGGTRGVFSGTDDQCAAANFPSLGGGSVQRRWYIQTDLLDGTSCIQTAIESIGAGTIPGRKFTRTLQGGWRPWVEDATLSNATLDPQTAGGLMSRTVVGGVAIQKFASGAMRMMSTITSSQVIAANSIGAIIQSMPAGFQAIDGLSVTAQPATSVDAYGVIFPVATSVTSFTAYVRNGATAQTFTLRYIAEGRWK